MTCKGKMNVGCILNYDLRKIKFGLP